MITEIDGFNVTFPCKPGATVYTIEKNGYPRPTYSIEEHIVEGFGVSSDKDGNIVISDPGEWGHEGLEEFHGCDGKWYKTREDAEAGIRGLEGYGD